MRTVQMTLDEDLLSAVDRVVKRLGTTRSAFARDALRAAVGRQRSLALEKKHRAGYERQPVRSGEFDVWESEHVWPD